MGTSPVARAQEIQWQGFLPPFVHNTGRIQSANATTAGPTHIAPADLWIRRILLEVKTVATNAAATLRFGYDADDDAYLDDYVLTNVAAGVYDITTSALLILRKIPALTPYRFSFVNADATGLISATVVLEPWKDQGSADN